MPIPSLSSAAKPQSRLNRVNSTSSRSERLEQPTSDEHARNAPALHKRSISHNVPSEHTASDAVQRRSFLPQRGLPKLASRPAGVAAAAEATHSRRDLGNLEETSGAVTSQQTTAGDANQGRPRPRSMYQTRALQQDRTKGADVNKPLHSVGLSRTQSLKRPGMPTQTVPAPATRAHMRTQSTNTPTGARKDTAGPNKVIPRMQRPKSLVAHISHSSSPDDLTVEAAAGAVRTSARLNAMTQSASTKSKPASSHDRAPSRTLDASGDHSQSTEVRETLKHEPRKLARPAFSTLQQHFTPKKQGKAPTSTFLHAPEAVNHVLPPEIVSLQNDLLQLHLLHETSSSTSKQWELSAKKALRMKFDEVASLNQIMQENERFGQEQKNILAFCEWTGSNSLSGLVEHIQALSSPLHELPSLLDPGGRFFDLVEAFGTWLSQVDEVWSARNGPGRQIMHSLEGLGDAWRGEHAAMTRKFTAFSRHLDSLPPTGKGSSIAYIVSRCQDLVKGLLSELQIMQATETEVISREKRWVEERLRTIAQDGMDVQSELAGEAWRMY